jgi:GT2 family glycosyltransferase
MNENREIKKKYPKVGIVILNWNGWEDTIECLESVFRNNYPNYQVIVVDNGSTDGSIKKIIEWANGNRKVLTPVSTHPLYYYSHPPTKKPIQYIIFSEKDLKNNINYKNIYKYMLLIKNNKNVGFAKGNNIAVKFLLKENYCDYILLLNNDTVVEKDFLLSAISIADRDEKIGIVGGKILFYEDINRIWSTGGYINLLKGRGVHLGNHEVDIGQFDKQREVHFVSGALMLIKKEALCKAGYLPEEYFFGAEEWDFSIKVHKYGYKLFYIPDFVCYHKVGGAHKRFDPKFIYNTYYNKILFQKKFLPPLLYRLWDILFLAYFKTIFPLKILLWNKQKKRKYGSSNRNQKINISHILKAIYFARRDAHIKKCISASYLEEIRKKCIM